MTSKTITFNDSRVAPNLAFGTGTALYSKEVSVQVSQAIKAGFTHIDCAEMYANEESAGQAIRECGVSRDKLFITTKTNSTDVRKSLQASLSKLGLEYVDLLLIHTPKTGDNAEMWLEMEALQAEGKALSIGVSNFRISDLEKVLAVAKVVPAINQIEFHPYVLQAAEPLLAFCKEKGIAIAAYGPLSPVFRAAGGPVDDPVQRAADARSCTPGNVLLLWALQKTGGEVVTTSTKMERLVEQLSTLELEPLTASEMAEINEAGKKKHQRFFMKHMDEA